MSEVTDIIITTFLDDGGSLDDHLNIDILSGKTGIYFVKASDETGGNKQMQADVFLAAVDYMEEDNFVKIFKTIIWEYPECVQLYLKREYDDLFECIKLQE